MKPFPCHYCSNLTLMTCRDQRNQDKDTNLVACCKDCKDRENAAKAKPFLFVSNIYKEYN